MATNNVKNLKLSIFGTGGPGSTKAVATASPDTFDITNSGVGIHYIPIMRSKDNTKQLPTYSAALQRSVDEYLAAEDLDNVQVELETLLSNVALRYRVIKSEYDSIDKDDRRNDRRTKHTGNTSGASSAPNSGEKLPTSPAAIAASAVSSGKRKRDDGTTVRKSKHTPGVTKLTKIPKPSSFADDNSEILGTSGHSHSGPNRDHHVQKLSLPKNDTPNKFWLSVEPYCMPLTNEDLRLLDDLLDQYSGPLVPPIPELGPHYSNLWASEELKEVQNTANPNGNRLKQHNNSSDNMLKKADSMLDECVTGPLTQRLVSALLEEQLIQSPVDLASVVDSSTSSSENTHSSAQINCFRTLSILRNGIGIEKRVKRELLEHGILDQSDFSNNDEDEIHAEIKRVIAELSNIAEYNGTALKRLSHAATDEINRLEIKRKLDAVDQEILETYKRTINSKSKRKPIATDEQQEIYRLTTEQKSLSDQLERAQPSCLFD